MSDSICRIQCNLSWPTGAICSDRSKESLETFITTTVTPSKEKSYSNKYVSVQLGRLDNLLFPVSFLPIFTRFN